MKRKSIELICIVVSLMIFQIKGVSSAQQKVNLFDEIILQTNSETVEFGLTASFKTIEEPKEICNYLIKTLELSSAEIKLNYIKNENSYCAEFLGRNIEGYIEAIRDDNGDIIKIDIRKKSNENGLVSLKNKVRNAIGDRGNNVEYFQYLKAKVQESGLSEGSQSIYVTNQRIIEILKNNGSKNIETVDIKNGLSTVAYTKRYKEKVSINKLMDFNYAVCNYSSGRYIIIGTPEIITTY